MGYKPQRTVYQMEFEDMPGLHVSAYGSSLGELMDMTEMDVKLNEKDPIKRMKVFTFLADRLVTWDMEHPDTKQVDGEWQPCERCGMTPGQIIPTTVDGMMCLEMPDIMGVFFGWISAVARVSAPKGMSSSGGVPNFQEDLMKRLGELQSLSKLPEPN